MYNHQELDQLLRPLCHDAIASQHFPGCVIGALLPDTTQFAMAVGYDGYAEDTAENQLSPMGIGSIFDLASLTKSFPVGTLALDLIASGQWHLDDSVQSLYPYLHTSHLGEVKLRHLLTHTLDFRFPMSALKDLDVDEILERVLGHQFIESPGSSFNYGNAASLLLGLALAYRSGESLQELAERKLFQPMGLLHSGWYPLEFADVWDIVPTERCSWRGREIRGDVHDESAYALRGIGPVGSAGMFSCVTDILAFLSMLLNDGVYNGQRILAPGVLALASTNAIAHLGATTALGWELANPRFMGSLASNATFGKTGFTGTSIVCDGKRNAALVLLSNFTWPKRESNPDRIHACRAKLSDVFFQWIDQSSDRPPNRPARMAQ